MDVLTDDGVHLHLEEWPAPAGAPTVLAVHGNTANRRSFAALGDQLADDVRLVAVDLRGRGRSDKPTDPAAYGFRRHAADVATVIEALGVAPITLIGHSMGAWVVLEVAAVRPDLVGSLVLVDGGYGPDLPAGVEPESILDAVLGPTLQRLRATYPSREAAKDVWRPLTCFAGTDWTPYVDTYLDEDVTEVDGAGASAVRARCSDIAARADYVDLFSPYLKADLAQVRCPVTLLLAPRGFDISPGTAAPLLPAEVVEAFQAVLPQLSTQTVEGVNHYTIGLTTRGATAVADAVRKATL